MTRDPDLGPAKLPDGQLDHAHPLNLGKDRTRWCCQAWWERFDASCTAQGPAPPWEDDGHHDQLPGVPRGRPRKLKADPEAQAVGSYRAPAKRKGRAR